MRLVNTYVDSLYKVDPSFLSDIRHKIVFAEYYDEHREFWFRELTRDFDVCRNEGSCSPKSIPVRWPNS